MTIDRDAWRATCSGKVMEERETRCALLRLVL